MSAWIAATAALLLVGVGFAVRGLKKRKAAALLEGRESLTDDEIYQRFYASSGFEKAAVIELWHEVARVLRAPAGQLRPTDKFGKEVGTYWITSEELDVLGATAQQRANRQEIAIDLASIQTVGDYVKQLARSRS